MNRKPLAALVGTLFFAGCVSALGQVVQVKQASDQQLLDPNWEPAVESVPVAEQVSADGTIAPAARKPATIQAAQPPRQYALTAAPTLPCAPDYCWVTAPHAPRQDRN